jgi:2-dehydro-3-deoxyglucarate aldolase
MNDSTFADALGRGDSPTGVWSTIGDPVVAELLAGEDFDFVVLDGEHSENTIADLADGIRAVEAAGADTAPVVRVSSADETELKRVLDLGPAGVVVPQIESFEAARDAVDAIRYPPAGIRGVAGGRASNYGRDLDEYVASADESVATILQVETPGAVEDIDAIAGLDGVDALFVGPADLSVRLGVFGEFESEQFEAAIDRVVEAGAANDVPVGTLATTVENVETRRDDWEMDFLVTGTDVGLLREGASQFLAQTD